jgi:FeS assembly SUF system protein
MTEVESQQAQDPKVETPELRSESVDRGDAPASAATSAVSGDAGTGEGRNAADVEYDLIAAVKTVYDPEIPVDIYELGLIYELNVGDAGDVHIVMTLTTPMCPAAEILPPEVEAKAREVDGVRDVRLELVWEPPWSMDMMSPAARLQLNL